MKKDTITLSVYGAERICASCANAPGSKDTYEWIQAAVSRRYSHGCVTYEYIDIFNPPAEEEHNHFSSRVRKEEFYYPVVRVNKEVIDEGNPSLRKIYRALEEAGLKKVN